jgi:uncharacterized Rmd1/YagE family protein
MKNLWTSRASSLLSFKRLYSESPVPLGKKRNTLRRLISQPEQVARQVVKYKDQPVIAACVAESFEFPRLLPFLQRHFILSPFICDDVLHVKIPSSKSDVFAHPGEIFFFRNGSLVFWSQDLPSQESALNALKTELIPQISQFNQSPYSKVDFEEMHFRFGQGLK